MATQLAPYLNFNGNCGEAMQFYQSVLGGHLHVQTFGESPAPVADEHKDRVMHAELHNDDLAFMASDGEPSSQVQFGNNINMSLMGSDEATLKRYFEGLSQGGQVTMPLAKQFWGDTFGMVTDKFGVNWMVNISSEQSP